jgi:hypothetical protein
MNEDLSLLAALTQCFEKDETFDGYHLRTVPFRTEAIARARFAAWRNELAHWLGPPDGEDSDDAAERVSWPQLRMKRSGRGVALWVRSAGVDRWWHDAALWQDPGLDGLWRWE